MAAAAATKAHWHVEGRGEQDDVRQAQGRGVVEEVREAAQIRVLPRARLVVVECPSLSSRSSARTSRPRCPRSSASATTRRCRCRASSTLNDEAQLHITTKPLGNYSYGKSSSLRSRRHLPVALSAK